MRLSQPSAPFEIIEPQGEAITIETDGKVLVLPTGDLTKLPCFNEYTLDANRLLISESPFGGHKRGVDYAPGAIYCQTTGASLSDVNKIYSAQRLSAGKLKDLGGLTIDINTQLISEEFIVKNDSTSHSATIIDSGNSTSGWDLVSGTGTLSIDSGAIHAAGNMSSGGTFNILKSVTLDFSSHQFICFQMKSSVAKLLRLSLKTTADGEANFIDWANSSRFIVTTDYQTFVLPLHAPTGNIGQNPTLSSTPALNDIRTIVVGLYGTANEPIVFWIKNITVDVEKSAYFEISTTDKLKEISGAIQCWNGTDYETVRVVKLDSDYITVSGDGSKLKFLDGTVVEDVFGAGNGSNFFAKRIAGQSLYESSMTYSLNQGSKYRIGGRVDFPPSDSGRTSFNSVRFRFLIYYSGPNDISDILTDNSGNNNNGTKFCVGDNNNVLGFDGIQSYIEADTLTNNINSTHTFSICLKINPSQVTRECSLFDCSLNASDRVGIGLAFNTISAGMYNGSSYVNVKSSTPIYKNNPYDIIYTFDGAVGKLYLNGVIQIGTDEPGTGDGAGKCTIGSRNNWYSPRFYQGLFNEFRVYSRALSQSEATAYHNSQSISSTGLICQYVTTSQINNAETTYIFNDSLDRSFGLQNLIKPWIGVYNPIDNFIEFYLFSHRLKKLEYVMDETGSIISLILYPGNGSIKHGRVIHFSPEFDSNKNLIPDILDDSSSVENTNVKYAYWQYNLNPATYSPKWEVLSHVSFTGFSAHADGSITKDSNNVDQYLPSVISSAHQNGVKVTLCIFSGNTTDIDTILATNAQTFANNVLSIVESSGADGLNLDFESPPDINSITSTSNTPIFENFMSVLNSTIKAANLNYHISFTVGKFVTNFCKGANTQNYTDAIVFMAYDYNMIATAANSPYLGPVGNDVAASIKDILLYYNRNKIILALPFYGYDFPTPSDIRGVTPGSAVTVNMSTAINGSVIHGRKFDSESNSPWYTYLDGSQWHQVFYDDPESLQLKYYYAITQQLAGVGFWSMGLEGTYSEIWDVFSVNDTMNDGSLVKFLKSFRTVD